MGQASSVVHPTKSARPSKPATWTAGCDGFLIAVAVVMTLALRSRSRTVAIYANATWADRHVSLGQRDKLARDAVATSREFDPETSRPARHGELLRPRPVQSWKNAVTISASSFDPPSGAAAPDGHRKGPDRQIRFVFGARPQPLGGAVDKQVGDLVRRFPILVSLRSQVLQFCARYQRLTIHFAPTTVSQTTANSIVSTTTAISRAIKSRSPSSST